MPKFRKVVVPPGVHFAPDASGRARPVPIPPERIARWVDQFRRMKAGGIKLPVCWGHQSKACPAEPGDRDAEEFLRSRYNATYVEDFLVNDKGELEMLAEAPPGYRVDDRTGALVNPDDHTQVAEVSLAALDWTDGRNNLWADAPRHVALTVLPVSHGTEGFRTADEPPAEGEVRLSLLTYREPLKLATEGTMPKDDKGEGEGGDLKALIAALGEAGLTIPDEVTTIPELIIAVKASAGNDKDDPPDEKPKEEPDMTTAGGAAFSTQPINLATAAAHPDPLIRALAHDKIEGHRRGYNAKLDEIEKSGLRNLAWVKSRRASLNALQLSLGADGRFGRGALEEVIDEVHAMIPRDERGNVRRWDDRTGFTFGTGVTEEPTPEESDEGRRKRAEEAGDAMSRSVGRVPAGEAAGKK